jgi:tripartite-type tricarboxylate transporter receptor subunit TctC
MRAAANKACDMEPVKAGKMRAIGVATPKRVDVMADVPTLAEAGLPLEKSAPGSG